MKVNNEIWNNQRLWITTNNQNKEFFDNCKSDVIFWNKVGKGSIDKSAAAQEKQRNLVEEEMKETEDAFKAKNVVEFIDGLGDTFVTQAYLEHLTDTLGTCYYADSYYDSILDNMDWQENIRGLLCSFYGDWKGALKEILSSNWTKFEVYDVSDEAEYDSHCGKLKLDGHFNVRWTKRDVYVVYQNENDKVLKGREYRKPVLDKFI